MMKMSDGPIQGDRFYLYGATQSTPMIPPSGVMKEVTEDINKVKTFGQFSIVDKPYHYNTGEIEAIDYIKDNMPREAFIGYLEGSVKKYAHRWRYKGGVEDLEKATWYLNKLVETLKERDKT
jgi:hypothetical protein